MNRTHDSMEVMPGRLAGEHRLRVPGDKSISQRIALLAGLADGVSRVTGFLRSEDCLHTLRAVQQLGASVEDRDDCLLIHGAQGRFRQPGSPLYLGNSGTGTRLLAGLLAGMPLEVTLTGDASLCSRPMRRVQEPLQRMGARIELSGEKGTLPMTIRGGGLQGIDYRMPMASAQVKSALLLAGLHAQGTVVLHQPALSRDHTERLFQTLGLPLRIQDLTIELDGYGPAGPDIKACELHVPGDFSSAAFAMVAAACSPSAALTIECVGLNPGRSAMLGVLERMGARVEIEPVPGAGSEPQGHVRIEGGTLFGTKIGGFDIPLLIDELPVLAVAAAFAEGETVIADAAELRHKECDRLAVMTRHLRTMGVEAEELPDGMVIRGPARITGGEWLDSHGDHRIAMAMTILALGAATPTRIGHVACVDTSYPAFWSDLQNMGVQCHECEGQ